MTTWATKRSTLNMAHMPTKLLMECECPSSLSYVVSNIFFRIASVKAEAEANATQTVQADAVREVPKNEEPGEEAASLAGEAGYDAFSFIHK